MKNNKDYPIFRHLDESHFDTIRIIDETYSASASGPQKATGKTLHIYGQFIFSLPEKFWPIDHPGHQYIQCSSTEEAEILCQELRQFIFTQWPDSLEWADEGWYRWMIHDMRQVTLKFE